MSHVFKHPGVSLESKLSNLLLNEMPDIESSLYSAAIHHFQTPGKAFRAHLALSSGIALKLEPESFLEWAAACELLHNASLVHDDISDASTHRRGRPSVNHHFGKDVALCLGDWMIAKAFELASRHHQYGGKLTSILSSVMQETCNGQVSDTVQRRISSLHSWQSIAKSKTAPLLMAPIEGVASIAKLNYEKESLEKIVGLCGLAYQGRNDIDDIVPSTQKSSDLIGRKPNLVISLYAANNQHKTDSFTEWYNSNDIGAAGKWQKIIGVSDAIQQSNSLVDTWLIEANHSITTMPESLHNTLKHIVDSVKLPVKKISRNRLA